MTGWTVTGPCNWEGGCATLKDMVDCKSSVFSCSNEWVSIPLHALVCDCDLAHAGVGMLRSCNWLPHRVCPRHHENMLRDWSAADQVAAEGDN